MIANQRSTRFHLRWPWSLSDTIQGTPTNRKMGQQGHRYRSLRSAHTDTAPDDPLLDQRLPAGRRHYRPPRLDCNRWRTSCLVPVVLHSALDCQSIGARCPEVKHRSVVAALCMPSCSQSADSPRNRKPAPSRCHTTSARGRMACLLSKDSADLRCTSSHSDSTTGRTRQVWRHTPRSPRRKQTGRLRPPLHH